MQMLRHNKRTGLGYSKSKQTYNGRSENLTSDLLCFWYLVCLYGTSIVYFQAISQKIAKLL